MYRRDANPAPDTMSMGEINGCATALALVTHIYHHDAEARLGLQYCRTSRGRHPAAARGAFHESSHGAGMRILGNNQAVTFLMLMILWRRQ